MDANEIMSELTSLITRDILKRPGKKIGPDDPLISNGMIDSFNLVDLALAVEDKFDVHIEDYELNASVFDSIRELAGLILSRMK